MSSLPIRYCGPGSTLTATSTVFDFVVDLRLDLRTGIHESASLEILLDALRTLIDRMHIHGFVDAESAFLREARIIGHLTRDIHFPQLEYRSLVMWTVTLTPLTSLAGVVSI